MRSAPVFWAMQTTVILLVIVACYVLLIRQATWGGWLVMASFGIQAIYLAAVFISRRVRRKRAPSTPSPGTSTDR